MIKNFDNRVEKNSYFIILVFFDAYVGRKIFKTTFKFRRRKN